MLPPVKGYIKSTLTHWEGRLGSVVFLPGCNLRCPFCNVPHLMGRGSSAEQIPFESVRAMWRKSADWIDGVVVTGGEPLVHENLDDLLIEIKALGFAVRVETNGMETGRLESLIKSRLVDSVAMDVKAPLTGRYSDLAGKIVDTSRVRESIELIINSGVEHEFRTTVVSALLDAADILDIARALAGAERYVLQEFDPEFCVSPVLKACRPYGRGMLQEVARMAGEYVTTVLRGGSGEKSRKAAR